MSEERFDRLETLIGQIAQGQNAMREDFHRLEDRIGGIEGRIGGIEDRIGGIEDRIGGIEDRIGGIDGRVGGLESRFNQLAQNQDALREDIVELRHRIDSVEGTVRIAIADGFRNHDSYLDDLNIDLAANERQIRRLNRRVARLEGA
jgi:trimeric autotransporter adhesin